METPLEGVLPLRAGANARLRAADHRHGVPLHRLSEAHEGAYSLTLMIPGDGLAVEGATELGALHRPESQHHYCPRCKSWLYTTSPRLQGMVNFRPTMLKDASWVAPYIESWVSEKLPGVVTGAKHSFDQFPSPDQYPELMAAFAREGARPS